MCSFFIRKIITFQEPQDFCLYFMGHNKVMRLHLDAKDPGNNILTGHLNALNTISLSREGKRRDRTERKQAPGPVPHWSSERPGHFQGSKEPSLLGWKILRSLAQSNFLPTDRVVLLQFLQPTTSYCRTQVKQPLHAREHELGSQQ